MRKEEAMIRMATEEREVREAGRKYVKQHGMKRNFDKFDNKAWFTVTPEWRKLLLYENRLGLKACFDNMTSMVWISW